MMTDEQNRATKVFGSSAFVLLLVFAAWRHDIGLMILAVIAIVAIVLEL